MMSWLELLRIAIPIEALVFILGLFYLTVHNHYFPDGTKQRWFCFVCVLISVPLLILVGGWASNPDNPDLIHQYAAVCQEHGLIISLYADFPHECIGVIDGEKVTYKVYLDQDLNQIVLEKVYNGKVR